MDLRNLHIIEEDIFIFGRSFRVGEQKLCGGIKHIHAQQADALVDGTLRERQKTNP